MTRHRLVLAILVVAYLVGAVVWGNIAWPRWYIRRQGVVGGGWRPSPTVPASVFFAVGLLAVALLVGAWAYLFRLAAQDRKREAEIRDRLKKIGERNRRQREPANIDETVRGR
jgi:uncharacterized membrane protein